MKKSFLTGLAILLPVAVTVAIALFFLNLFTKPFMGLALPLMELLPEPFHSEMMLKRLTQVCILIFFFFLILLLGIVARWFFFSSLIKLGDYLMQHVPVISKIYKTSREIINTLMGSQRPHFHQVVLLPFPNPRCYVLGLITGEAPSDGDLVSVYIPTTPNPTTGYLIIRPKQEMILLDMRTEDALKLIISCGVVQPRLKP